MPAENEVDGDALLKLTERAVELLIPMVGPRMKFLTKLEYLKAQPQTEAETGDEQGQVGERAVAPGNDAEEGNEQKGRYAPIS